MSQMTWTCVCGESVTADPSLLPFGWTESYPEHCDSCECYVVFCPKCSAGHARTLPTGEIHHSWVIPMARTEIGEPRYGEVVQLRLRVRDIDASRAFAAELRRWADFVDGFNRDYPGR